MVPSSGRDQLPGFLRPDANVVGPTSIVTDPGFKPDHDLLSKLRKTRFE
jgi:hypothetical protein